MIMFFIYILDILVFLLLLPFFMAFSSIFGVAIKKRKQKAISDLETAEKHARYKYLINDDVGMISFKYDDGNIISVKNMLNDIYNKHCVIENSNSLPIIKNEIDKLLNVELVKILNQFHEVHKAGMSDKLPTNSDIAYRQIFVNKINDIAKYLSNVIEKQVATESLLDFDINKYVAQSTLSQAENLIEPIKKRGNKVLANISKHDNIETSIIIDKLVNQYLLEVAMNYQFALKQEKPIDGRTPDDILKSIFNKIERYLDEVEKGSNRNTLTVKDEPKRDHYNELLVFERYLDKRI